MNSPVQNCWSSVYYCDDQSCLHIILRSSNIWSFIYSLLLYKSPWYTASGNKLIKMIRYPYVKIYPHLWRYRWFPWSLPLKLYLNSLVYHRNIFESSSKVFGHLRKFSEDVRNVRLAFRNLRKVVGNHQKTPSSVCLYNKKNITR